jgi:hypothetical protein
VIDRPEEFAAPEGGCSAPADRAAALDALLSRRAMLQAALVAGAGLVLVGCASGGSGSGSGGPRVRWPEESDAGHDFPERTRRTWDPRTPQPLPPSAGLPAGVNPRSSWAQGQPIPSRMDRMLPVNRITIHHDGMPPVALRSRAEVAERIEQIRRAHLAQGWGDVGYHYIIDPSGQVWEGRPLVWQGAHVKDQNPGNLGVMCLGNFEQQSPSMAQTAALDYFVAEQMRRYNVPVTRVKTHREMAQTVCPGRNLQSYVNRSRSGGALAHA